MKLRKIWAAVLALLLGGVGQLTGQAQAETGQGEIAYRQEMAKLICEIKEYSKGHAGKDFFIIANGGAGLMEETELLPGADRGRLINGLDGIMAESVHFGWDMTMDEPAPQENHAEFTGLLACAADAGIVPLVLDYAVKPDNQEKSYRMAQRAGYVEWVSPRRELDRIPYEVPYGVNSDDCRDLKQIRNFLVILNPAYYPTKEAYVEALASSEYDLLIIDLYYGEEPLTRQDVAQLQQKPQGGKRLVAAYMSVGEAEEYRSYWQAGWKENPPDWLEESNEAWAGSYRVRYWRPGWQQLLLGQKDSYLDLILSAGFDGAFLDVVDVFYFFENKACSVGGVM